MTDQGAPTPAPTPTGPFPGGATAATAAKADLMKRFVAAVIDGAIAVVLSRIPAIGWLLGALYILLRDGFEVSFMDTRSLGKRLMKLRPVRLDGKPMTLAWSLRRNWTLTLASATPVLLLVPILGWLLIPLLAVVGGLLSLVEIVLVVTDPEGRRLGDRFADTKVIEVES